MYFIDTVHLSVNYPPEQSSKLFFMPFDDIKWSAVAFLLPYENVLLNVFHILSALTNASHDKRNVLISIRKTHLRLLPLM